MGGFGGSSKMTELKKSAADLVSEIVERLSAGTLELEQARGLAAQVAKLLGGLPPPAELVKGLVRCGLTVQEVTEVLGPPEMPEQAPEAGAPAAAASIEQLTYVPGLLGELINWNLRTARYPSRVMALAAAIAVVGKLLDRKVAGPTNSGTHLYTVVLAPTGSGKQHQLDVVKTLLTAAGLGDLIGPGDFSSVQALQQLIKEKNSCIAVMDEFGSFLRRIKDGAQMSNMREITGEIRTLWSSWIQYDSVKKAKEDSVRVISPAFAIFGVTTAGDFYSALKTQDASNGFLNRFLILEEKCRGEEKEPESWVHDVPFALMERLQKIAAKYPSAPGGSGPVKPQSKLEWGPDACELYRQFNRSIRSESDDRVLELRIRAPEMAVRLATIRACGKLSKTVDVDDIEWAIELARVSADMLCAGVAEHMVPEGLDGLCEKIIEVVSEKKWSVQRARNLSIRPSAHQAGHRSPRGARVFGERGTD